MQRNAEETKRNLLAAAGEEFAAYGIAGARTGRIARVAGVNEALVFRYFGSKEALFEAVYDYLVNEVVDDVPLDADDLPGYAGALFDYYRAHQQVLRLSIWTALERPTSAIAPAVLAATQAKVSAIKSAQTAGVVASQLPASELLALLIQLSLSGAQVSPTLGITQDPTTRRASIVCAVQSLTAPPNS